MNQSRGGINDNTLTPRLLIIIATAFMMIAVQVGCSDGEQQTPGPVETETPQLSPTNETGVSGVQTNEPVSKDLSATTVFPILVLSATPTLTPTATPLPEPLPTEKATSTPVPTVGTYPTATPLPTAIPTATPLPTAIPTATPIPTPDPRYGVAVTSAIDHVSSLGVARYLDFGAGAQDIPPGTSKLLYIKSVSPVPASAIAAAAAVAPGSIWYVLGEPNVPEIDPADIVVGLHDTYVAIKAADPTARITSPSILNFDFTCIGCRGYQTGHSWVESFITTYDSVYGENPPVDYWAIDVYPIIWDIAQLPTTRSDIVIDQIDGFRQYLDGISSEASKPIIVTEIGLHWGFEGLEFDGPTCPGAYPTGEYKTDEVTDYLGAVFNWLESNSVSKNIESWYLFSTYRDLSECHPDGGYGLTLFETPNAGSALSPVGQFFYNWIRGMKN